MTFPVGQASSLSLNLRAERPNACVASKLRSAEHFPFGCAPNVTFLTPHVGQARLLTRRTRHCELLYSTCRYGPLGFRRNPEASISGSSSVPRIVHNRIGVVITVVSRAIITSMQ